jgi:hypothetical protein
MHIDAIYPTLVYAPAETVTGEETLAVPLGAQSVRQVPWFGAVRGS